MNHAMLVGLVLLLLGYLLRRIEGSWVAPAPFWVLLWAMYVLGASVLFSTLDALTTAAVYVTGAACAVALGSTLGYRERVDLAHLTPQVLRASLPGLPWVVLLALGASLLDLSLVFGRFGGGVRDVFSFPAVVRVVISARSQSYSGIIQTTPIEWLCILMVYLGGLAGGALFRLRTGIRDTVLGLAGLIAASIVLGLAGSRMGALYGGAFWVAAYLATAVASAPDLKHLDRGALAGALTAGTFGIVGVSILVMLVRYATDFEAVGWRAVLVDPFGFFGAFGLWLDERGLVSSNFTAGARSLTRLVGFVGVREPALPAIAVEFTSSNIYTIFRDLIEDVGTIGSLVLLGLLGWVARRGFERARSGSLTGVGVLLTVFVFSLTSFAVGVFFYSATTLALGGALAYLLWAAECRRHSAVGTLALPRQLPQSETADGR